MTVLELVIVLGIVAGATTMAALSIPELTGGDAPVAHRLSAFVKDAQLAAIQSGAPLLLTIEQGAAQAGERRFSWAASDLRVLAGGQHVQGYRVLISPEGVINGARLSLEVGSVVTPVSGVYREGLR